MTALKVFFACALGAFIGAIVTLQLSSPFWWLGAIAGFVVGYLTYEPKTVLVAVLRAGKSVLGWSPNAPFWKTFGALFASMLSVITVWVAVFFLMVFVMTHEPAADRHGILLFFGIVYAFMCVLFPAMMASMATPSDASPSEYAFLRKRAAEFFLESHPVTIIAMCYRGLKKLVYLAPKVLPLLKEVFRLIHSDIRLLCGVDAAIGAGIGYFSGNALIGALAGGILGVLNYYLVSVLILKVVPSR